MNHYAASGDSKQSGSTMVEGRRDTGKLRTDHAVMSGENIFEADLALSSPRDAALLGGVTD
jgi:hypothetical protein